MKFFYSACIVAVVVVLNVLAAPFSFPRNTVVVIPEGFTISETAHLLEEKNIIRSSLFFSLLATTFGGERKVVSGSYGFERPLSVIHVFYRIRNGITGLPLVKITIPEGATNRDIARTLNESLSSLDEVEFLEKAQPYEGYLFPETYLFTDGVTTDMVIETMRGEFERNSELIQSDIEAFGRPLHEVVIMASLLEKEARLYETRQVVAGILWNRITLGMPLQVDAVFGYIHDVPTFNPSFSQLEIDSLYNTYTNSGFPPTAIGNPGLEAIKAAANPIKTSYLFYLTGSDGMMHYAKTFEEHVANRKYLR